jgi:two-component system, OmpR family, sensor kinase
VNERAGVRPWFVVRVYLYGVLMIALAAGASFLVGRYSLRPALDGPARPASTWIAWHMAALADRPEELNAQLADLKKRVGIEISLYELDGRLIAHSGNAPLPPVTGDELEKLKREQSIFGRGTGIVLSPPTPKGVSRYAVLHYRAPEFPVVLLLKQLAVALFVLALVSIPLARSVTAPLARLSSLARRFGKGDLSARVHSKRRDEIGALARAFDDMADRIATLRRSEKELLANISHELRTPLARIRLALELVSDGDSAKVSSYLNDIGEDLGELEQLLDDVMSTARNDLARDSAGDALPPLHFEALSGSTVLEAAESRFHVRCPDRKLEADIPTDLPTLEADPSLLRRVLDNLLDNARKFSEEPVHLSGRGAADGSHLVFEVKDRGIGISAEDQTRIFEPFFRSDPSRTRATGGVGLGLAVVKRIVEAHSGTIEVHSVLGQGTRFVVTLPLEQVPVSARNSVLPRAS